MRKLYILSFLIILFTHTTFGQATCPSSYTNQWTWPTHAKWYYGDGNILSFGATGSATGTSSKFTGAGSPFKSYESTASACDEKGNLILATNGVNL
jgi:hypothetical protein